MKFGNKSRFAILGVLLEGPSSGYEIKSLMQRSTVHFWRESDSTIYPMLKVLKKQNLVSSEIVFVGKKKKEVFSITDMGREEFKTWYVAPTATETPRNEFLLKLFFAMNRKQMARLYNERLIVMQEKYKEYYEIQERLQSLPDSIRKQVRLTALQYGIAQIQAEMQWLKSQFERGV